MAFLDSKKAFPSVWREGLWEKMKEYGIDGKFLRVCQNLYCDVGARVRVGKVFFRSGTRLKRVSGKVVFYHHHFFLFF